MAHKSVRLTIKNDRIVALEERQGLLERLFDAHLTTLETEIGKLDAQQEIIFNQMDSLKKNELAHLAIDIQEIKADFKEKWADSQKQIRELQKIVYKAIGAVGAILAIVQFALRFLK